MTAEVTIESLQAEIARLKTHADDLLAERKAEKQRREAAESTLEALTNERDSLAARVDDLSLTGPVLRALESVTACPPIQGRKLLEEAGIKFAIGKEGTAVAIDGEAEIPLPDLRQHLSKKCETPEGMAALGWFIRGSGASGSGAKGGATPGYYTQPTPNAASQTPVQNLGLR